MKLQFEAMLEPNAPEPANRCVVRLATSAWADKRGVHLKKSLTFLRRKSSGFNLLEEDVSATGADWVLPRILNLDETPDGVYEVVTCNESRDYETGYIDDYDYVLEKVCDGEGEQE